MMQATQKFQFVFGVQHDDRVLPDTCPWFPYQDGMGVFWCKKTGVVGVRLGSPVSIDSAKLTPAADAQAWHLWGIMRRRVPAMQTMYPGVWIVPENS